MAVEVTKGQVLEAVEYPGPHRGQKALADGADLVDLPARGDGPDHVDPEEHEHDPGEPGDVAGEDVAVYGASDQPWAACLRRSPEHDQAEHGEELARVGPELPEQTPGCRTPVFGALLRRAGYGFNAPDLCPLGRLHQVFEFDLAVAAWIVVGRINDD